MFRHEMKGRALPLLFRRLDVDMGNPQGKPLNLFLFFFALPARLLKDIENREGLPCRATSTSV